jgi:hypothetical protein
MAYALELREASVTRAQEDPRLSRAATVRAVRNALAETIPAARSPEEAIETSLLAVLAALYPHLPVRRCADESCGKPFLFPSGEGRTRLRSAAVKFCSRACAKRSAERERYRRLHADRIARRARERSARAARTGPDRPAWQRIPAQVREAVGLPRPEARVPPPP